MQPHNNNHRKSTSSSLIQNKKIRSLYVVISSVVQRITWLYVCLLFVQFQCSEKAFQSFDRSPVNKHKLKKKVFKLLSNSSFLHAGTFIDHIICFHIICFQIFCNHLYTYFNYKKRNSNFTATHLDKILAAFSASEQLYR